MNNVLSGRRKIPCNSISFFDFFSFFLPFLDNTHYSFPVKTPDILSRDRAIFFRKLPLYRLILEILIDWEKKKMP